LVRLMVEAPDRLAPHLHAPLQSGSDAVLRRMGRHWYTAGDYRRRLEALAASLPVFGLGADIMVGFPGETDGDFSATCRVVEDLPFTYLHVFPYSERPATAAARLGSSPDATVAGKRSVVLRDLVRRKAERYARRREGSTGDVVTLSRAAGWYEGLTEDYLSVHWAAAAAAPPRFRARLHVEPDGTMVAHPEAAP